MTLLMAACCAQGRTVLRGAAREPEIGDMIAFLCACGADISGYGTSILTVQGGRPLGGAVHAPLPDRIAAATYAAALAAAGGDIRITGCNPALYGAFLQFLAQTGVQIENGPDWAGLARNPAVPLRGGVQLCADAWPPLPPTPRPWQPPYCWRQKGRAKFLTACSPTALPAPPVFAAMGAEVTGPKGGG